MADIDPSFLKDSIFDYVDSEGFFRYGTHYHNIYEVYNDIQERLKEYGYHLVDPEIDDCLISGQIKPIKPS